MSSFVLFTPDKAIKLHEGECPAAALQILGQPQFWSVEEVSLSRGLASGGQDTHRGGGHRDPDQGGALHGLPETELRNEDSD